MEKLVFQDLDGNDQQIEVTLLPDRILAVCNGSTAIFPLYDRNKPRDPDALAAEIYELAYSGDNKYHRKNITNEIAEWLKDGDGGAGRTAADLAKEWIEYDQEPEKDEIQ